MTCKPKYLSNKNRTSPDFVDLLLATKRKNLVQVVMNKVSFVAISAGQAKKYAIAVTRKSFSYIF